MTSIFGSYAVNNNVFDVWIMLGATLLTLMLRTVSIPILPLVLALILEPLLEENIVLLSITADGVGDILARPIAVGFLAVSLVLAGWVTLQRTRQYRTGS